MSDPLVYAEIGTADSWSGELEVTDFDFAIAVWGTFAASVRLQIKPVWRDVAAVWIDVITYTAPVVNMSFPVKGTCRVRAGVPAGLFTSGKVKLALYRGEDDSRRAIVSKKFIS